MIQRPANYRGDGRRPQPVAANLVVRLNQSRGLGGTVWR